MAKHLGGAHPSGAFGAGDLDGSQTPAERKAAQRRAQRRRQRRLVRIGQGVIAVAVVMAIVHMGAHLEMWGGGQPSGLVDWVAGYPMVGLLFVVGVVLVGR